MRASACNACHASRTTRGAAGCQLRFTYLKARAVAVACRYRRGKRGFSGAGRYGGLSTWDHVDAQDAFVTVMAMFRRAWKTSQPLLRSKAPTRN